MSRIEMKLESCFENGNYYEAHQIYRTLYNRMCNQEKWQELQDMLYNGALRLLSVKEATSAIDLAELYVEVLEKSKTPVSSTVLDRFEELFNRLPAQLEKDLETSSEQDRRKQYLSLGVKWSMAVSEKIRYRQRGHPQLHLRLARSLWREGNYAFARGHFMHSDDPETFAIFLVQYQQKCGYIVEKDLFITQAVLQVLYFTALVEQYENELKRDPEYKHYLDKMGQIYLGLPQPPSAGSGLLGNMIKGLLRNEAETAKETDVDSDELVDIPLSNDVECSFRTPSMKLSEKLPQSSAVQNGDSMTDDMDLD